MQNKKVYPSNRIYIVGVGNVGSSIAYSLINRNIGEEIVLIDVNESLLKGQYLDLLNSIEFFSTCSLKIGNLENLQDGDIVIVAAGVNQKSDGKETRLELLQRNYSILSPIFRNIKKQNKKVYLIIVTNPVDVLTYFATIESGLPTNMVFGTGTYLDSIRLKNFLSQKLNLIYKDLVAFVIGEHGDSSLPIFSNAFYQKYSLFSIVEKERLDKYEFINEATEYVRKYAYQIISKKGSTYYGIGSVTSFLCEVILKNKSIDVPLSVYLENTEVYGLKAKVASVMVNLSVDGWSIVDFVIDNKEMLMFENSVRIINNAIENIL